MALDINKQVIYLRNARGSVIARQLVAISEAQELVQFYVYPGSAPTQVKRCLMDYSEHLAERLGVPLARPKKGEDCDIALVIAEDWWEDSIVTGAP